MAWTIGQPAKIGPQGLMQHQEVTFTSDSTSQTAVAHGLGVRPQLYFVRSTTGGTHLATLSADGLSVLVTPSAAATTGVVVAIAYSQAA